MQTQSDECGADGDGNVASINTAPEPGIDDALPYLTLLREQSEGRLGVHESDVKTRLLTVSNTLKSLFTLVSTSAKAEEQFYNCITFGAFGDVVDTFLKGIFTLEKTTDDDQVEVAAFVKFCVIYFIGFSVGDGVLMNCGEIGDVAEKIAAISKSDGGMLRYPQAFSVAIQLMSLWNGKLGADSTLQLMSICLELTKIPGNSRHLASSGALEIILRAFTATSRGTHTFYEANVDNLALSRALLEENNVFHNIAAALIETISLASCSLAAVDYWVKTLLYLCRVRSRYLMDSQPSLRPRSTSRRFSLASSQHEITVLSAKLPQSPIPVLLRLLVKMAGATFERTNGTPVIEFDMSKEGFGCFQIPDINSRAVSIAEPAASSSSLPTFMHNAKVWPPPDGYSVMVWFRVDSYELKSEREKLYRECFMANTCIHCRGKVQDELELKCSHRACRGCIEALRNSGGECVVCNPPKFYLFRFRSVDGKSVSEGFLKGGRICMRTSASRASAYQFTHAPIKTRQWYHAVFTHSKQRFQSSMVSFYLNGILQETVKISYPSSISGNQPLSGLVGVPSQARRCSSSRWTLGPFYLLDLAIATPVVNAVFAIGPSYDGLFSGATGNNEIGITFDQLAIPNMVLLDEYMWNPVRSLIESVDIDHGSRNKLLRRSLSIASAASSTAAAIVQDMKSNANLYARVPSAVPLIHVAIPYDRIMVSYSAQNSCPGELSVIPSRKLDGRPTGHLMGGTALSETATMANVMFQICSSGCQVAYGLLYEASTTQEVELALDLLCCLMQSNPRNLAAMEQENGYGLVNYLLHQKASFISDKCLQTLLRIVGVDIEIDDPERPGYVAGEFDQVYRDSAIRNLQALQYFILDYGLWQKVPKQGTVKLLFSSLYSCLAADDDTIRERNRTQLQSMSIIRQLLYVLIDPKISTELLRVIVDVILVCLTSSSRESTAEANFADVAGFLATTLSPRFGQYRGIATDEESLRESNISANDYMNGDDEKEKAPEERGPDACAVTSVTARLCLSPRGTRRRNGDNWHDTESTASDRSLRSKAHQTKIQGFLLEMLLKAVQKYDIKETKEHGDYPDVLLVSEAGPSGTPTPVVATSSTGGGSVAPRMQLPTIFRMSGFRKSLEPHWMEYFLFPGEATDFSIGIAPPTVIAALRLLCALLGHSGYESVFKKEGYYRLLAQGLPCRHSVFSSAATTTKTHDPAGYFPFQEMWYALLSALLGAPIDGHPHEIRFEIEHLRKDFELNVQRDRVVNPSILTVLMILLRRHYNDPVAMVSAIANIATDDLAVNPAPTDFEVKREEINRLPSIVSLSPENELYHLEVLDFLQHIFESMPSLHTMFITGSETIRLEFVEELTRLVCAAARNRLMDNYPIDPEHIIQVLQSKRIPVTAYNVAVCRTEMAEEAASIDVNGSDPFLHHPIAARALGLLIALLMKFLLDSPNGHNLVEEYVNCTASATTVLPRLHSGLLLRFQSLVVLGLLDHVRAKFNDDEVLVKHKPFGPNVRDFVKFVVEKMHCWQRAQHGDGCPPVFACCGRAHFIGGPSRLLELVLFVLAEANGGVMGTNGGGSPSLVVPASSSLGGLFSDKLGKGKKRRAFRQFIGRMNMSRPAELDNLLSGMHTALNAVVLHVLHGRGAEVEDDELEAMLQLIHAYRDVVFGLQDNQDTTFLACLCRYLLQLLADSTSHSLQEAATHVWIDLMHYQTDFMTELLTIEIRKSGVPSYSVNLMKNGFDVLLECATAPSGPEEAPLIVQLPSFIKFAKWLELVGPPLKELESNLDRIFIKTVIQTKEIVHDAWAAYHKEVVYRKSKSEKQFGLRYDWLIQMEKEYVESLLCAQQREFRRQRKWSQDRIDHHKFIVRQWQNFQQQFAQNLVDPDRERHCDDAVDESKVVTSSNSTLMAGIVERCAYEVPPPPQQHYYWRLDFTEGPFRMRKRLSRIVQPSGYENSSRNLVSDSNVRSRADIMNNVITKHNDRMWSRVRKRRRLHRCYSEADIDLCVAAMRNNVTSMKTKQRIVRQLSDETITSAQNLGKKKLLAPSMSASAVLNSREKLRRGSFDAMFNKYVKPERASWRDNLRFTRLSARQESTEGSGGNSDDGEEKKEEIDYHNSGETAATFETPDSNLGSVLTEDIVDEKLRPLLMLGDDIDDIYDCLRIDGMDSCPGVFLLCNDHVYIVDNYQLLDHQFPPQGKESDYMQHKTQVRVVEVAQGTTTLLERQLSWRLRQKTPRHAGLSGAATSGLATESVSKDIHQCRFWAYEDIIELHKRRYQLRHVAIEIFANDGRNYLVTVESPEQRELVFHALLSKCPNVRGAASGMDGVAAGDDLYSQLRKLLRNSMTERWVHGDISNFAYLMHLNTLAGRSYNDLTQYPVFPWILADYESSELDLTNPDVYRDLSKPMGALRREEEFRARYEGLMESAASEGGTDNPLSSRPFHYGTHYSSAATTLLYLMRLEPFTSHFQCLHGGKFDHADRLFTSVDGAWKSAAGFEGAQNGTQDVKEIIPEFFYLPEFLENVNECAFGKSQTGVVVGDVELPPWANGSATEFVRLNRAALESPYVSAHLHHWIDLIFGFKQQGPAAVEACNVFYHLTYEGSVDLDAITDVSTKRALLDQITEFGQTPSQLFRTPHPTRAVSASTGINVSTNSSFLSNSIGATVDSGIQGGPEEPVDLPGSTTSHGDGSSIVASPMTTRNALANSFLEGELITRMQTILSNGTGRNGTFLSEADMTSSHTLENAVLLQQAHRRQVSTNPLLALYHHNYLTTNNSTGIRHIAWTSGGVGGREERVLAVGPNCLLIPPRNYEFLAWGFQDRTVKVISAGPAESGGHGGDSKVIACLELDVDIDVAAITTDSHIVVTSSPDLPVLRVWRFKATRRSLAASIAVASGTTSAAATSSSAAAVASSLAAASSLSGSHRRRTHATIGSSTRSLTLMGTISTPAHHHRLTALQVSRAYSILVSGCGGGVAVLWDLNRRRFIRRLPSMSSDRDQNGASVTITAICINEVTGDIIVASGMRFGVYDVNGVLRVCLDDSVVSFHDPAAFSRTPITSLAVNRGEECEWSADKHIVTGYADGTLRVWAYSQAASPVQEEPRSSKSKQSWSIELQGQHRVESGSAITAVCVTPDKSKLYTGTQDGQLIQWTVGSSPSR